MADSHTDFPRYPLERGVPGGLPLVNFPEISMWGQSPWGGYGANPLPARLERLWRQASGKLSGGFPYSEGIYEDINKVICARLCWDPDRPAIETVKEFERRLRVSDMVIKFLTVRIDETLKRLEKRKKDRDKRAHRKATAAPAPAPSFPQQTAEAPAMPGLPKEA